MAFQAPFQEVGFNNAGIRAYRVGDIVTAMTVRANGHGFCRFVMPCILQFVKLQGYAVKVGKIRIHYRCGKPVLSHDCLVPVTIAADVGYPFPVIHRGRVLNGMRRVAIGAHRDILVVFVEQRVSMDASRIDVVDVRMAPLAPLRDQRAFLAYPRYAVRAVTVNTNRSSQVPPAQHGIMDALHCFSIFIKMTAPAIFR